MCQWDDYRNLISPRASLNFGCGNTCSLPEIDLPFNDRWNLLKNRKQHLLILGGGEKSKLQPWLFQSNSRFIDGEGDEVVE